MEDKVEYKDIEDELLEEFGMTQEEAEDLDDTFCNAPELEDL